MRDYKFRQSDHPVRKSRSKWRKIILRGAWLALATGAVYGFIQLGIPWKGDSKTLETDPDTILLPLPPYTEPEESPQPISSDANRRAELATEQTFLESGNDLHRPRFSGALVTASQSSVATEAKLVQATGEGSTTATGEDIPGAIREDEIPIAGESGVWIEHEVKPGDTLAKIFQDNDLSPQLLQSILRSGKEARRLKTIRPKDKLRIHLDREQQFAELHLKLDALRSVKFAATDAGIKGTRVRKETETKAAATSGIIDHTLFSSAGEAGVPDAIIMQLIKIFGWDIDFALEIRPGDRFTVIYEEVWAEGEQVGSGNVIAAEFVNRGHPHRAIRFEDSHGKNEYYSPEGVPLRKTFFRTPVKFTRITSLFSKRRWHPVLNRWRAHKGVDYAAPSGTPIIATADATVEYCGWKKGYGRVVYLRHGPKYRTVYGHMSRFVKGLKTGNRVVQGETIGYVGASGLATGPHLHYEFHVDGVHRNPLTVTAPIADPLRPEEMKRFRRIAAPLLASLEQTAIDMIVADAR